ncbi:MAG: EF-P lysine aminoacylase GenX [Deltaproteobacteria bacterium]|nr:EF-P lysine aminoacylase GenX [Deltaproteobacteria bacterium]
MEPFREVDRLRARNRSGRSRRALIELRARMTAAFRAGLDRRGYIEIHSPVLVRSPGTDPNIEPISVPGWGYLATSPEFQLKRLLVGGFERIYSVGPAFRADERGPHHNPEFVIAEWYHVGVGYLEFAEETEAFLAELAQDVTGSMVVDTAWGRLDLTPPWPRLTIAQAFERLAGMPFSMDRDHMYESARQQGMIVPDDADWQELFFRVFVERIEPNLGGDRPVFLMDWPEPLAALARTRTNDDGQTVAERFEIFAGGIELANAYGELTEAREQSRRFQRDLDRRRGLGRPAYPGDDRLVAALEEGLPSCSGIALGMDRLAMLLFGCGSIEDVMAFTIEEL